ncbi:hypothetical protein OPV22_024678 [Ensete ventricosum]|uniref:Uncharacterized protein n=1 Tax=Ensete ventricosum TaxID=4639 RepID=A0AAV8Q7Q2_ENSVE|nr:hypothetical protein OPV22_024678 [Ensete ventricosum]
MEGLIPYIYGAIKRRKAPRYYRSMSTGASQWFGIPNTTKFLRPTPIKLGSFHEDENGHRRQYSLEDFSEPPFSPDKAGRHGRLVKETSSRNLCIERIPSQRTYETASQDHRYASLQGKSMSFSESWKKQKNIQFDESGSRQEQPFPC